MTTSQTTLKTCRQCAHSQDIGVLYCRDILDPVDGQPMQCSDARDHDKCGPDAKLFEQRETITEIVNRAPITNISGDVKEWAGNRKETLGQMYKGDDPDLMKFLKGPDRDK